MKILELHNLLVCGEVPFTFSITHINFNKAEYKISFCKNTSGLTGDVIQFVKDEHYPTDDAPLVCNGDLIFLSKKEDREWYSASSLYQEIYKRFLKFSSGTSDNYIKQPYYGGKTGDVLIKSSDESGDFKWHHPVTEHKASYKNRDILFASPLTVSFYFNDNEASASMDFANITNETDLLKIFKTFEELIDNN